MSQLTQNNRLLKIKTVFKENTLLLDQMHGREAVSEPFHLDLQLISDDGNLELKKVLGTKMTIRLLEASRQERLFHGHVAVFQKIGSDGGLCLYRAILKPFTIFLEHRINCRVFQEKTRQDIIKQICDEYGTLAKIEFNVTKDPAATLLVQYNESDWAFISRLAEEAGWSYSFRHEAEQHTLVFQDDSTVCEEMPSGSKLKYNTEAGAADQDSVHQWGGSRQLVSNKTASKTFDFKNPGSPMHVKVDTHHEMGDLPDMESYFHRGAYTYKDDDLGKELTTLRIEEYEAASKSFFGQSNVRHLQTGYWFELKGHWEHDKDRAEDRQFLVLSIEHDACNNYLAEGGQTVYTNTFECIRKKVPYRPGLRTRKPVMRGPQTATVTGPKDEEIYCDKHGRVRIQFHWDREGAFNDQSLCWVRVTTQWAGQRFGFVSMPRVGTEVIVDFLEGDPDRPIITGAVYNATNMPPWDLPDNKTQSGIYTNSTPKGGYEDANALRFEDKKGEEEIWIHAQKDQRIEVENDETTDVGHDRTETVGNNENITIGVNRTESVGANEDITIGANRTEKVGANETITIGGGQSITVMMNKNENILIADTLQVGGAKTTTIGAAYAVTVGGAMNTMVGLAQFEEVGLNQTVIVGKDQSIDIKKNQTLKVGKKILIDAGDELAIQVGQSKLIMKKDGTITLKGKEITLESTGKSTVKAGGELTLKGSKVAEN